VSKKAIRRIRAGVLTPKGYRGAGVASGLKNTKGALDLALIVSDTPATAAGVFTSNRVCGMPVNVSRRRLRNGRLQAIVVNAGNANVCTGPRGLANADFMTKATAAALGLKKADVAVCSTGVIGRQLPMDRILAGIQRAAGEIASGSAASAAVSRAIMTTDTVPKSAAVSVRIGRTEARVAGTAKGAGMIAPHLATMLCFITTDAAVEASALRAVLREVAGLTFNHVTVDGDQSTSDSVIVMANGAAGGTVLGEGSRDLKVFRDAVFAVADSLAEQLARDGEGATKYIEVRVKGARSKRDAELAGRAIAESLLFKCAIFGGDPNWGRIACAAGYSGARFREEDLAIVIGGVPVVRGGTPLEASQASLAAAFQRKDIAIEVGLGAGSCEAMFRTCDLSHEYIDINALYHT